MKGLTINGDIIAGLKKTLPGKKPETYIGTIAVMMPGINMTITPNNITINERSRKWKLRGHAHKKHAHWSFEGNTMTIVYQNTVHFMIGRRRYSRHNPQRVDFLWFYLPNYDGLSDDAQGLVGMYRRCHKTNKTMINRYDAEQQCSHPPQQRRCRGM